MLNLSFPVIANSSNKVARYFLATSTVLWINYMNISPKSLIRNIFHLCTNDQVVEVSTSKTGKHGHAKCHFVAIDIFNGKKLEDIVPSSHNCDVIFFLYYCFLPEFVFKQTHLWLAKYADTFHFFSSFQVPHVNRTDYQLIDISEDGFVSCFLVQPTRSFL